MRRIFKTVLRYFFLLLLLLSFGSILNSSAALSSGGSPVIYYRSDQPATADDLKQLRSDDEDAQIHIPFTACGSISAQSFVNPDLGKTAECEVIYISGDSSLMVNSYGGQLFEDDTDACLLSTKAASELFGEPSVTSGSVEYNEKTYNVRGVCDYDEAVVILPAASIMSSSQNSGTSSQNSPSSANTDPDEVDISGQSADTGSQEYNFNRLIIRPDENASREEIIQIFENRSGSYTDKADCIVYQRLSGFLVLLLPVMILFAAMFRAVKFTVSSRYKPFYMAAGILGIIVMWILFFFLTGIRISIPPDLIPSRWSDFDFWGRKIAEFRTSIAHILFMSKSEIELSFFEPLAGMTGMAVIMVILFFIDLRLSRADSRRVFGADIAAVLITELTAILIMKQGTTEAASLRMIIVLWPYLLLSGFLFSPHADSALKAPSDKENK